MKGSKWGGCAEVRRASEPGEEKEQEGGEADGEAGGSRRPEALPVKAWPLTEVAKCRAMDLMAECRVIWMRKLPGQGGQTSPLDEE